jgi:hypothetical protein
VKLEQASKVKVRTSTRLNNGKAARTGKEIDMCTRLVRRGNGHGTPERAMRAIGGDPSRARVAASTPL